MTFTISSCAFMVLYSTLLDISIQRTPFSISCEAGLVVTNSLSFFVWETFYPSIISEGVSLGILFMVDSVFFLFFCVCLLLLLSLLFFSTLNMSSRYLPAQKVSVEKPVIILWGSLAYNSSLFSCCLKIFCLFFGFFLCLWLLTT